MYQPLHSVLPFTRRRENNAWDPITGLRPFPEGGTAVNRRLQGVGRSPNPGARPAFHRVGRCRAGGTAGAIRMAADHQRQRILAGAATALAEHDYGELSVANIIAAAGVSRAAFYAHFDNKRECVL